MKGIKIFVLTLVFMLCASSAFALTSGGSIYIDPFTPNNIERQSDYMQANLLQPDTFNSVYIGWRMYSGDSCGLTWFDSLGNIISESLVDASTVGLSNDGYSISPPSGAVLCMLLMHTGSASGIRLLWYTEVSNMTGGEITFPAPDLSSYVPPVTPPVDIGWGTPAQPTFEVPIVEVVRTLITPVLVNPTIRPIVTPSPIVVTPVQDNGDRAVSVPIPSYTVPDNIPSPSALPSIPDPSSALPPRQSPVIKQNAFTRGFSGTAVAPLIRIAPLVPLIQLRDSFTRVMPDTVTVQSRTFMTSQVFTQNAVLVRAPVGIVAP